MIIHLPAYTNVPSLLLSLRGTQFDNKLWTDGKTKPWENPCIHRIVITPFDPKLSAKSGINIPVDEQIDIAATRNHFGPYVFASHPAPIWGST